MSRIEQTAERGQTQNKQKTPVCFVSGNGDKTEADLLSALKQTSEV